MGVPAHDERDFDAAHILGADAPSHQPSYVSG